MKSIIKAIMLFALILLLSCTTFTSYQTAQTTSPNQLKIGGAITPVFIGISGGAGAYFVPIPEIEAKLGVSDNLDFGARWSFGPGVALNTKYQFLKNNFDGAIFLEGSFYGLMSHGEGFGFYSFKPTLLFSREKAGMTPFSFGIGLYHFGVITGDATGGFTSLCGHVGIPYRIGANRNIRIMPELTFLVPLFSNYHSNNQSGFTTSLDALAITFGIGVANVSSLRIIK
ncbi:MAG: hypothetical protein ABIK31_03960 [candidate division WOR-3 bacterium]